MFEVEREIPVKVGAGGLNLVDLILVEADVIQSAKAERESECHNEKEG